MKFRFSRICRYIPSPFLYLLIYSPYLLPSRCLPFSLQMVNPQVLRKGCETHVIKHWRDREGRLPVKTGCYPPNDVIRLSHYFSVSTSYHLQFLLSLFRLFNGLSYLNNLSDLCKSQHWLRCAALSFIPWSDYQNMGLQHRMKSLQFLFIKLRKNSSLKDYIPADLRPYLN